MSGISPQQVLAFRIHAQQLDRDTGTTADLAVLDIGAQDTGADGGLWALEVRGADTAAAAPDELATVWSLRGAPHVYRRADLPSVAAAVTPFSEADAAKRILNAAKPLKAAGISALTARDTVAEQMHAIVTEPMVKGDVSTALTARLDPPYLRYCRPCDATHCYEMPFRLGALRGGVQLQAGTSPPVLERLPGHRPEPARPQHDVVRAYLRLLGPATPRQVVWAISTRQPRACRLAGHPMPCQSTSGASSAGCLPRTWTASPMPTPKQRACSVPTTCSCRPATATCWSTTRPTQKRSGRSSAALAPSW